MAEQVDKMASDWPRASTIMFHVESMNRRPKITDSWIATKWAPIQHRLNTHFQALAVMHYDSRDMLTDACNRLSNLRLIKDASKQIMNAKQYCTFYDDVEKGT